MQPRSTADRVPLDELPAVGVKESLYPETLLGLPDGEPEIKVFRRVAVVLVLGVLGFVGYHVVQASELTLVVGVDALVLSAIGLAYLLRDRIGAETASAVLLGAGLFHVGFVGWIHGGLVAPSMAFIAFPPWLAMFLLRMRWALVMAFATVAVVLVLAAAEAVGWLQAPAGLTGPAQALRFAYPLAAVVSGTAIGWIQERARGTARRDLERATRRARAMLDALPDTFVLLTPLGEIREARVPAGSALSGLSRLVNHPITVMLDPREAERFQAALADVARSARSSTVEMRMMLAGDVIDIEAHVSAHPEGDLVALLRDITLQKRSRRVKDEFVSTVSHELRTPLTSIHGSLALLRNRAAGELGDSAKGIVELAWRYSDRLRRLIDDLLDVQKMEFGQLDLRMGEFELDELLARAVASDRLYAEQYGIGLALELDAAGCRVRVDDDRFHQVVSNLLSNAIKYSPEGEQVRIRSTCLDDGVRVSIIDRGPGIPDDFRARVFETFAQADSSKTRMVGGTGLGLSICRRLVTAFGGRIGFNTAPDEGTTFWFDLPTIRAR